MRYSIILSIAFTFTFISCASNLVQETSEVRPFEVFDEFLELVDQRYIYFDQKEINWEMVGDKYRAQINADMTEEDLFELCNEALLELRDAHCRMESNFKKSRGYKFAADYEVHYSWDVINENYLVSEFEEVGNIKHIIINEKIGYMRINKMTSYGALPRIAREMKAEGIKGLVIDIRSNGGGDSNPVPDMIRYFSDQPLSLGYYIEKSGPGHNDVTDPIEMKITPSEEFYFGLPVTVLTNRSSYSASSYFAAMFKTVEGVTIVGQVTGGGGGGNYSVELSNGWLVAVSVSDYLDVNLNSIEPGVMPDILIENTREEIEAGKDVMLEKAIEIVLQG